MDLQNRKIGLAIKIFEHQLQMPAKLKDVSFLLNNEQENWGLYINQKPDLAM